MHVVIKGTNTIAEYKALKKRLVDDATKNFEAHKAACEHWSHGEITKVWLDWNLNLCIEYEDGQWWHYNEDGEWW